MKLLKLSLHHGKLNIKEESFEVLGYKQGQILLKNENREYAINKEIIGKVKTLGYVDEYYAYHTHVYIEDTDIEKTIDFFLSLVKSNLEEEKNKAQKNIDLVDSFIIQRKNS